MQEDFKKEETINEFSDSQFWKAPESEMDLDALMAEMD